MKEGICLSEGDFQLYVNNNKEAILNKYKAKGLTSIDLYETKLEISTQDEPGVKNIYYLVNNSYVIESWKTYKNPNDSELQDAQESYYSKWQKYIQFAIECLNEEIQDNEYAVTDSAQLIARLILTIFNQSKSTCFAEEGNTLSEEIRVYEDREDAKKHNDNYKVYSHKEICASNNYTKVAKQDPPLVRIVDNEGSVVTRASCGLKLINIILSFEDLEYEKDMLNNYIQEYNDYCQFDTKVSLLNQELQKYNQKLPVNNYKYIYIYHVAKHLYSVFDFKPLEENVLVPTKADPQKVQVTVYASAERTNISYYAKKMVMNIEQNLIMQQKGIMYMLYFVTY